MFRPTNQPSQVAQDRRTYIPPDVEKAMSEHMQRSIPTHLKKYQGGATYVPEHAENEMTEHLETSLPEHMKQYTGAYMQQRVVHPSLGKPNVAAGSSPDTISNTTAAQPPQQVIPPNGPQENYTPNALPEQDRTAPDQPYNFITNPAPPPKQPIMSRLPGGNSPIIRILIVLGGLLVLLILFSVLRSTFSGNSNLTTSFITVAQDQQELIHLATNAGQQKDLSTSNQNLAATMQLGLTSSQAKLIKYLVNNHKKINDKTLNLKVSKATDDQLTAAAAATTYNQTFHEIVQTKLTAYDNALQQAYKQTKGKKGRALLSDSYQQAQLFQVQLTETTN